MFLDSFVTSNAFIISMTIVLFFIALGGITLFRYFKDSNKQEVVKNETNEQIEENKNEDVE